jgi:hypothetical protein
MLLEDPPESPASFLEESSYTCPLSLGWTFLEVLFLSVATYMTTFMYLRWNSNFICSIVGLLDWCQVHAAIIFVCQINSVVKHALIFVFFSCSFIILSLSTIQLCSSTIRLLKVSARSRGVPTVLLLSESSSLLWEPSPTSRVSLHSMRL